LKIKFKRIGTRRYRRPIPGNDFFRIKTRQTPMSDYQWRIAIQCFHRNARPAGARAQYQGGGASGQTPSQSFCGQ